MGFFQSLFGVGGDSGASGLISEATSRLKSVKAPTAEDLTYELENLVSQGVITPEQAQTFLLESTAFSDIERDPRLRAAEMDALSSLQDISRQGGLTATDRARLEEVVGRMGSEARGAREAAMQRFREQGRAGTPLELVAQLQADQDAATTANRTGLDIAAQAEQRALEALMQSANIGSQVRGEDFSEAARIAEAKDAMERFNKEHLQSTEMANVSARNDAQARNLAERQRIADENARIKGENRAISVNAKQTTYQNEMDRQKAIANALAAQAQAEAERKARDDQFTGSLIGAGATLGTGLLTMSDERSKDISDKGLDMDAFMESLEPIAFRYKNPESAGAAPGENVGVKAQDVEKSDVGRTMVKDTPGGKMLDMQKGFGVILAALASLYDKIEDKEEAPSNA